MNPSRTYDLCSHPSGCKDRAAGSDQRGPLCAKHLQKGTMVLSFGYVERAERSAA
jgi:hypothetical protein